MTARWTALAAIMTIALVAAGCGKRKYGAGCKKAAQLTAPWTELDLPIDESQTRVCDSSSSKLKLRSYAWTTKSEARAAMEEAVTASGYAKDRCSAQACYYTKDGHTVSVQPMPMTIKKRKVQTVVLNRRKASARK